MQNLLSQRIQKTPPSFIRSILKTTLDSEIISFAGGLPNPISFPKEELLDSMQKIVHDYGDKVFQYSITAGIIELREFIAHSFNQKHGLNLTHENVLITTGSQQALDLIGKVFINEGDNIIIEKPSYLGAIQAFYQYQPTFCPVELTPNGLEPEGLKEALKTPTKLVYSIPNFQNPTGLTYSTQNRKEICEILCAQKLVLVEDDPYGALRFEGESLPYIGIDKHPFSLVLGTFSKTCSPAMRLGFIISKNTEILKQLSVAKEASDLHSNTFAQYLIWDYLKHNDYEKHIAKIRALYQAQAHAMLEAMEQYFPKNVCWTKPEGGMFLWVTLPKNISAMQLFPKALEQKVVFVPGDCFYINSKDINTMRLNYTNASCEMIHEGIKRLGNVLGEVC